MKKLFELIRRKMKENVLVELLIKATVILLVLLLANGILRIVRNFI